MEVKNYIDKMYWCRLHIKEMHFRKMLNKVHQQAKLKEAEKGKNVCVFVASK